MLQEIFHAFSFLKRIINLKTPIYGKREVDHERKAYFPFFLFEAYT